MAKAPVNIRSLARAHTEKAVQVLGGIMSNEDVPPAARVQAAQALLDRGWGKPTQPISGDEEMGAVEVVTRIELVAPPDVDGTGSAST